MNEYPNIDTWRGLHYNAFSFEGKHLNFEHIFFKNRVAESIHAHVGVKNERAQQVTRI